MRREWWWCAAILVVAGCSTGGGEGATASTSTTTETTGVVSVMAPTPPAVETVELQVGPGPEVMVSGGLLPSAVTSAISSKGGELADTASWDARYETFGLPRIAGPGVRLVAGEIEALAVDGGWQRRDALQWLFIASVHSRGNWRRDVAHRRHHRIAINRRLQQCQAVAASRKFSE